MIEGGELAARLCCTPGAGAVEISRGLVLHPIDCYPHEITNPVCRSNRLSTAPTPDAHLS